MLTVQLKSLRPFYFAALSLLGTGFILNPYRKMSDMLFLGWICISGIYLVYRLNDFIDQTDGFHFDYAKFLSDKIRLFFSIQLIILITIALFNLSLLRFWILATAAIAGFLYSYKIELGKTYLRLKHVFIVKNILIGLGWGSLVLVGSNHLDRLSIVFALFASVQVFIGSSIRDIGDLEKDRKDGVQSMPVVLGIPGSLKILFFTNILLFLLLLSLLYTESINHVLILPLLITCCWRALVINRVTYSSDMRWQQKWNLWTCNILFIGTITSWVFTR